MKRELKKLISIISLGAIILTSVPTSVLYASDAVIPIEEISTENTAEIVDIVEDISEDIAQINEASNTEEIAEIEEKSAIGTDDNTSYGKVSTEDEQILRAEGRTYNADKNTIAVEVNQGFSYHIVTTAEGGIINATEENTEDVPMNDFTSEKPTAIMVRLPGVFDEDEAKKKLEGFTVAITYANSRNILFEADCGAFSYQLYTNHNDEVVGYMAIYRLEDGFAQNSFNIYLRNPSKKTVAGRSKVNFYKVKKLRILLVPCIAYYSESGYDQNDPVSQKCPPDQLNKPVKCDPELLDGLDNRIYNYIMDVYPHSDVEIQWAKPANFGTKKYDLADDDDSKDDNGTWMMWDGLRDLQPKAGSGVEQYDRILGFVQYRQGKESHLMGYTYGSPANIITLTDGDMLATVAHEMAHNYGVGDEYDNEKSSSLNPNINPVPNGFKGIDIISREAFESHAPYVVATSPEQLSSGEGVNNPEHFSGKVNCASGAVVFPNLHTYSFSKNELIGFINYKEGENEKIQPIVSFMGSGFDNSEYYFSNPFIWERIFKESLVKGSSKNSRESENISAAAENAEIIRNADETILTVDDVIDPSYREGSSNLIEVSGKIRYNSASSNAVPVADNPVELDVPYSYDGDLSEIGEDETCLDSSLSDYDIYVFAALDKNGNIIKSPVDGVESKHTFYAGNYNVEACSRSDISKYLNWGTFNFVAEYPEGTDKFVIYPEARPNEILKEIKVPNTEPDGNVVYSDINENKAKVDWTINEYDVDTDEIVDGKAADLHVEVFYAPEGDNGVLYPIIEGKNKDFPGKDNYGLVTGANWNTVEFDTSEYGWSSDAYVLIAVSNGVNAEYMYSDDNNITLGNVNTTIAVNKGKRGTDNLKHFTYTGEEITPSVVVKVYDAEAGKYVKLKEDVDYTLEYDNNINAGVAKVTATGIGSYAGSVSGKFVIDPAPIRKAKLSAMADLIYDGTIDESIWGNDKCNSLVDVENNMIVRLSGKELYLDSDYIATYNDKNELPVPKDSIESVTVKIKGVGNYTGEVTVRDAFKLYPASLVKGVISANSVINWDSNKAYSFTGKEIKPKVKSVIVNGEKLNKKYYKVTYSNNIKTGVGNINIVGKNGYVGCINTTFNIGKMKTSKLTVKGVSNVVYTGKVIGSDVSFPIRVYAGKVKLTENKDYTISYNGVLDKPSNGLSKDDKPSVVITLKDDSKIVEWKKPEWKGGAKKVVKKFNIKKAPFSSRSLVIINLDSVSENGLKHFFSKNTDSKLLKKYFYILTSSNVNKDGQKDSINGTITNENVNMKLYVKGKELDRSKYTVEIKIPRLLNKVGKLTIKPTDTTYYSGKRTVLFLME